MKLLPFILFFSHSVLSYENTIPANYEQLAGCEKQNILWNQIEQTTHRELPEYKRLGAKEVAKMALQRMTYKTDRQSDFAPEGWIKYLHQKGAVAKVSFKRTEDNKYSGVFQGFDCGLIRLSITYKPTRRKAFAPGLALKVLRDGVPSANISALYALNGQEDDYNFFKNPLSNIVPRGKSIGEKAIHRIFSKVTPYPEELLLNHFGRHNQRGEVQLQSHTPRQIFFQAPNDLRNKFRSSSHDVREDFLSLEKGTLLYRVYALPHHLKSDDYVEEYSLEDIPEYLASSIHIGDLYLESEFKASEFGDTGILFRHEIRKK